MHEKQIDLLLSAHFVGEIGNFGYAMLAVGGKIAHVADDRDARAAEIAEQRKSEA